MSATTTELLQIEIARTVLIDRNQQLLESIVDLDHDTYNSLCADDISCIEPETNHNVVIGKNFHEYYFDVFSSNDDDSAATSKKTHHINVTMVQPHVQWINGNGSCDKKFQPTGAVLSYVKLVQQTTVGKAPVTTQQSETRVWEIRNGEWVNIHFHKSPVR